MNLKGKKILVTGGTGMVGQELVPQLLEKGAIVSIASLDDPKRSKQIEAEFIHTDLRNFNNCISAIKGKNIVVHLAGIKGSPSLTASQPASFFVPTIQFNTNVLEAARLADVEWTLYTSTVGVYGPAETFYEDQLWDSFPSKNDWFAGWAKRMGELQLEAYRIQYKNHRSSIVRPVNIHGKFDNFNPKTSMVIPSLIYRAIFAKDKMTVWGDGSPIRDFINSYDVARAMIFCLENEIQEPVNIGSGKGHSIKELVEIITRVINPNLEVVWETDKPNGDTIRVADMTKLFSHGFKLEKSLEQSIRETIEWYKTNQEDINKRYEVFDK